MKRKDNRSGRKKRPTPQDVRRASPALERAIATVKEARGQAEALGRTMTVRLEIPHEPGNFMLLRRLLPAELDAAQSESLDQTLSEYGAGATDPVSGNLLLALPHVEGHDELYLVDRGVRGWYGPLYDDVPCDKANKEGLDEPTVAWAAREILHRSQQAVGAGFPSMRAVAAHLRDCVSPPYTYREIEKVLTIQHTKPPKSPISVLAGQGRAALKKRGIRCPLHPLPAMLRAVLEVERNQRAG